MLQTTALGRFEEECSVVLRGGMGAGCVRQQEENEAGCPPRVHLAQAGWCSLPKLLEGANPDREPAAQEALGGPRVPTRTGLAPASPVGPVLLQRRCCQERRVKGLLKPTDLV